MEKQRRTFLSYSRANKEFALKLARELKSEGFPVWLDLLDIPLGARWDVEVEKALIECEVFMIIITKDSIASENVLDEIVSKRAFLGRVAKKHSNDQPHLRLDVDDALGRRG